jgi:uncharacterized membrane protein YdjX (TVP38/TMEM64 family)
MKKHHRYLGYALLITIILSLSILPFLFEEVRNLASPTYLRNLLINAGVGGYAILVGLLIASIPLPIPSVPSILAGGYVYGTWLGSLISLVGIAIGSTVSFFLVRHIGRPLLEKMVDKHHLDHFQHIFKKRGLIAVVISYALPIFPSDAVSSFLGFTRIKYSVFILLVIIGHIPRLLIINSLGNDLWSGFSTTTLLIVFLSVSLVTIAAFRETIKRFLFKELKAIEKEAKILERKVS